MTGLFLLIMIIISIILSLIAYYSSDEDVIIVSHFSLVITFLLVLSIPISRIESKANAQECIVLQETLDYNRNELSGEYNAIERHPLMEHVIIANMHIVKWNVKAEKWYQNKWYYHPLTKTIDYIK